MNLFENLQLMMEKSPIASMPITNSTSLNIYDIEYGIEDKVLVGYDEESAEWVEINYGTGDTHPYFDFNGERHSTDFFMKNESKALTERDNLSVNEYNKLKIALNKNNSMKGNFILHPGKMEVNDYKVTLSINGAFRNYEHSRNSYHRYRGEFKNDQVTKEGVGTHLYYAIINLMDESIKFSDFDSYYIKNYVKQYNDYLIKNGYITNSEMNIDSLTDNIINTAKQSQVDLENILHSKNFIYNLTGKRKTLSKDSDEYNLNLENTKLTEDFDQSMPNWLMRAIKVHNSERSYGHKDLNYNLPLDSMKWEVEPFPEKGKLNNIGNDEYIALLVDRSGDEHRGNYVVYFPAAYIGNNETIEINGRNRRIDSMSLRALAPYVKEYAHAVGSKDARANVTSIQKDRSAAKNGSIDRATDDDLYTYGYADKIDKSGYVVDPNKYKRLLAQLNSSKYAERLEDVYIVLSDLKTKLKDYVSQDDMIPDAKADRYAQRKASVGNFNRAYKYYEDAIRNYKWATDELDRISNGKRGRWGDEATQQFTKYLADTEVLIVQCLNVIEPKTQQ